MLMEAFNANLSLCVQTVTESCGQTLKIRTVQSITLYSYWNVFMYFIDINECEPSNDCMHQCKNTQGSFNCSCNEFFVVDPTDWRKCVGMHRISFSSLLSVVAPILYLPWELF